MMDNVSKTVRTPVGTPSFANAFRNRLYYLLKPAIPQALRMRIRRRLAVRIRRKAPGTWPIMPGAEQPPLGWTGWPDGKKFAVVLTHDVEGTIGLKNVQKLAELEAGLGFTSSFNFIPKGDYTVPPDLRAAHADRLRQ